MNNIKPFGILIISFLAPIVFFCNADGNECINNDWQPTFVIHDSVAPTAYYYSGTSFFPMGSPDEAQQTCQVQGVRMAINGQDCFQRSWNDFLCGCNHRPNHNYTCNAFLRYLSVLPGPNRRDAIPIFDLGRTWEETESGWTGIWRRRGASNIFDAHWRHFRGMEHRALITITIHGTAVTAIRQDPSGGSCTYTGLLGPDQSAGGTFTCSWAPEPMSWSAVIRY